MEREKARPRVRWTGMGIVILTALGLSWLIFVAQEAEAWQWAVGSFLHVGGWFAFAPSVADSILDAWESVGPGG